MSEAEHVTGLMGQDFAAPAQEQCLITRRPRFTVKCRIVSGKAVDANALT